MDHDLEDSKVHAGKVEQLRVEWKRLWKDHFNDKVLAEGVASQDYSALLVEKGTVIFATRNFKSLSFKGILEEQGLSAERFASPNPSVGGWGKFIKSTVNYGKPVRANRQRAQLMLEEKRKAQQSRKSGKGWLHA